MIYRVVYPLDCPDDLATNEYKQKAQTESLGHR